MPDIIQVAEDLKNAPDQWLAQQMQQPSGSAPPWLVASEVARRERLRSGATKAQAPKSSVSQDLINSLYARIPPTAGLMGTPTPPGMPPVNLSPGSNPSTLGAAPGGTPPGNFKMPARMASGGQFDDEDDQDQYEGAGQEPSTLTQHNSIFRVPSRREQISELMGRTNDAVLGAGQTERNVIGSIVPRRVNDAVQGMGQTERNIAGGIAGDYGTAAGQVNNAMQGVGATERNITGGIGGDYLNAGRAGVNAITNAAGQVNNAVMGAGQAGRNVMGSVIDRLRAPQQAPVQAAVPQQTTAPASVPAPQQPPARTAPPDELARLVEETAQRYQLPPELLKAVISKESSWNPQAIGPVTKSGEHALGLMQVLPSTAAGEFGVTDPKQLFDPAVNMDTGARYLKKLLVQYNGDTQKALMAYNMGPGALQRNGGRPYQSTDAYVKNINDDINAQRKAVGLPAFDYSQTPNARSRLLDQVNRQTEEASAMPALAVPAAPGTSETLDVAPVAPGAPATKATTARQEPLHQTWAPSAISPEAAIIQRQIDEKQQGRVPVEDRLKALASQENLDMLNNIGRSIFGAPPDYSKYSDAINQVMAMAQKQMNPSIGQGLIDWGLAMMANPSHNFGVAMGQSGAYAMGKYQSQRQQGMQDFLAATKAGIELQAKEDAYSEKIGQYKMQRLGAREAGITADDRLLQGDINALYRQKNTAQINYEKKLATPDAVNNMAMAIMNRERVVYDPKGGDPIDQLVATGNKAWVDEAYLSSKPATGRTSSVERTQDMRATSLLAMMKHTWNPEENPDDAQFPNATKKLEKMYPELLSLATTAAGANLPEQMREAEGIADAIMAGNQDPNMQGMYGKQTLVKFLLESKYKFDLVKATQEFNAVKDFLRTAQSGPRLKFMSDLNFVSNQIPLVMNSYEAWKSYMAQEHPEFLSRYPVINRAALEASIALGGKASEIATPLLNHVNELVATLPGVYSGGFAPHNEDALRAGTMIHAWSDEGTFKAAMKVITDTTLARKNATNMLMPFGVRTDSPYTKNLPGSTAAGATNTQTTGSGGKIVPAANVQKYVADHPGITYEQAKAAFEAKGYTVQ